VNNCIVCRWLILLTLLNVKFVFIGSCHWSFADVKGQIRDKIKG